jgi:hypothetical protein
MPQLAALIPALISAAVGGTELGLSLSGAGQPSPHAGQAALQQQQAQFDAQQRAQQVQAIRSQLANATAQTGGSLTDTSNLNLASIIAGFPGHLGAGSQPGATSLTGAPPSLVDQVFGLSGGSH